MPTKDDSGVLPDIIVTPRVAMPTGPLAAEAPGPTDRRAMQLRLLTEPLLSSWAGPGVGSHFVAMADVGLFVGVKRPALRADLLLSLDVNLPERAGINFARAYVAWEYGKMPDVVMEMVTDGREHRATPAWEEYACRGVTYYVIYDAAKSPDAAVRVLELRGGQYEVRQDSGLPAVGLGLTFWRGMHEGTDGVWLRWCDRDGRLVTTSKEHAEQHR